MQLLTQELARTIPPLYSQEHEADPLCRVRFFMPDRAFTRFVIEGSTREKDGCGWGVNCHHRPLTEYDPARDDVLFFGNVTGLESELGISPCLSSPRSGACSSWRWNGTGASPGAAVRGQGRAATAGPASRSVSLANDRLCDTLLSGHPNPLRQTSTRSATTPASKGSS